MNPTSNPLTRDELQHHNQQLTEQNLRLEQQNQELALKLKWYEEQVRLLQHKRFGASSEKTHPDQLELNLFNEAEAETLPQPPEPTVETLTYTRKKYPGQREDKLAGLPQQTQEYRLAESEQICPCCGGHLHEIGSDTHRELIVIPAQMNVLNQVRFRYGCRRCEREGITTPIVTAPGPKSIHPGSLASPSAVAHILNQKYGQGVPLYRQEQELKRQGVDLSRQTMANWVIAAATLWFVLLYERMHTLLVARDHLHADETPVQVLREPGRTAEQESYMWLYRSGRLGPAIVLYDYQPGRKGEYPREFLSGFRGYLQVDGYAGYHKVKNATLVGCWAHARREFTDALKALPPGVTAEGTKAQEGLDFCNRLFALERQWQEEEPKKRQELRMEQSVPVLEAFREWLRSQRNRVLPKSKLGNALTYCVNQWEKLTVFVKDGRLELDNNRSERAIKPFVIGRKNWLFANTPKGATASAITYSLIETAKENGLKPYEYLRYVLEQLPQLPDPKDVQALDALLPWSHTLPADLRIPPTP
ncbi:IS66 family transposase [Paenibacillus sp. YN15]|uniref:IS66 family transposase n=1 Tax=Paenibacillus sp. YN15 TaxID=1742774 RepID=UPI000DCC5E7D|nr:IS66 family transposase [Paenibacillus sp. YN15]RAU90856.1 IS66 family transposase [Paenibacillus sp. YN15]